MSTPISLHTVTLDNGLRVCVSEDPGAPAVSVNFWFEVGSFDETPGRTGFAHLFEHLMFQGSTNVEAGEHMALIEAYGGTVNASTSSERTNYYQTVPPGALELVLWLEADRLSSLDISAENFEAQRAVVKEEKRQRYDNQPYGDMLELLVGQHYGTEHPYGHLPIGSMADLDAAALDDVQAFFDAWYHPGNARLVICGNVSADDALPMVERHLGALAPGTMRVRNSIPSAVEPGQELHVRRDVPHALAYASWLTVPMSDPAWLASELAMSVLADGHTSRLYRTAVKQTGLAHEVHASSLGHLRDRSITTVMARPTPSSSTSQALDLIAMAITDFAAEGPTDEELRRSIAQYERDWLTELATVESRADAIQEAWLNFDDPARIRSRLTELQSITADDVRNAAAQIAACPPSFLHYLTEES